VRTLQAILDRKRERRLKLEQALAHVAAQLAALGAEKVILFGSVARGDIGPGSDLDLLAIMPPSRSGHKWSQTIYAQVDRGVACDILVYTPDELRENLPVSALLRRILKEGVVVYEAESARGSPPLADPRPG